MLQNKPRIAPCKDLNAEPHPADADVEPSQEAKLFAAVGAHHLRLCCGCAGGTLSPSLAATAVYDTNAGAFSMPSTYSTS